MRFKIGQKVVALCTYRGIIKNSIYFIENIWACKCGNISISVGIGVESCYNGTNCQCGTDINHTCDSVQWYRQSRFAPIQEDFNEQAEQAVNELIEELELELV